MSQSLYGHIANAACGCEVKLDVDVTYAGRCYCGPDDYCYCYDYGDPAEVTSLEIVNPCKEHSGNNTG